MATLQDDGKGETLPSPEPKKGGKLGLISGVYIPVYLNILSILMFLRFGVILGQVGFVGILGLLVTAYMINTLTILSLSAIASNGEVKGGGAYYLISRSLGPEFGGSIGILFFLAQAVNTAMNIVGLIDCIRLNVGPAFPQGYWAGYGLQTAALILCTTLCLLGSAIFSKASNALLVVLTVAILSIPISTLFKSPFDDAAANVEYTGPSLSTFAGNFLPHTVGSEFEGVQTFRNLFGILFPATSGIFAGASMSGDLKNPSHAIPKGTLWAVLTTFIAYFIVVFAMAATTTHDSLITNANVIPLINLSEPVILAGECAVTVFSALMGIIGAAKLFQALARDKLLPGLSIFGKGTRKSDEPFLAIVLTYAIAQVALLADLNQIATFISMGYQMTFLVMNLACFLLKIGSAPNFRPSFQFFSWQTALLGSLMSAAAMFFIDETYAVMAICFLVFVFLLIHYLCPPKRWGDVSQNLIYHQVRKYLLRLRPEHIKFWRPHIILLINNPRRQARLIQFCNSLKKGSLYILGHVIVTDDFNSGVHEARLQQQAWTNYISEFSRIKAFVQLTMSPSITWGVRNLILSAGLGGMRPNIAVLGFYNMEDLRNSNPRIYIPDIPMSPADKMSRPPSKTEGKLPKRRRGDTSARLLEGFLPTDVIRTENMMSPTRYMTMLEDLTLQYRLNVAVAYGFDKLETPRKDRSNTKKFVDLWPIQMSAEVTSEGKSVLTTNFDTYTLILQLGHILNSVQTWRRVYSIRVMVFVEYENEVEEECARVQALLEKLRIDAKVIVFWLASGDLSTYELIVNGTSNDIDTEIIVNEALKDEEWWDELQAFRGRAGNLSSSQELSQIAHIMETTAGRPGAYNPHEESNDRHRPSMADITEIPKKPDIAILSKMGVSMGIHTHHLNDEVLLESSSDEETGSELDLSDNDTETVIGFSESVNEPLLSSRIHRRDRRRDTMRSETSSAAYESRGRQKATAGMVSTQSTYGTINPAGAAPERQPRQSETTASITAESQLVPELVKTVASPRTHPLPERDESPKESFPALEPFNLPPMPSMPQASNSRPRSLSPKKSRSGIITPIRPVMSRQSSAVKFSSRPVPETQITTEEEGSKIGFATTSPVTPVKSGRPTHSRQSSLGKFSSRPVPPTRTVVGGEISRTISFAEGSSQSPAQATHSAQHSRHHSRQGSEYSTFEQQGDVSLSIPELLESYRHGSGTDEDADNSSYSTGGVALSFNDLPSRAQHLILNELMRQNSRDTAVLMTTLPIPSEGTNLDEQATVQYLSDVEVLSNELPPTLMVLSNNMTVTVSL